MSSTNQMTLEPSTPNLQMSKRVIIKNLAVVCTCFVLCFTAFNGTISLQTSLSTENFGSHSLTILQLSAVISNLFLATLVLYKLGIKYSLMTSLFIYVAFPASNIFPVWYSLYPAVALTGLCSGPLWNAKSVYITLLGERYAALSGESPEVVVSLFFGVFYMVYRISLLTGNVISSIVIHRPASTHVLSDRGKIIIRSLCGANYCHEDLYVVIGRQVVNTSITNNIESIYRPTNFQKNLLFGIYILCGLLAVPLAATINAIDTSGKKESVKIIPAFLSTMRHMKNPKEIALIPLSLLSGVTYAFIMADYCEAFITCTIGIDNIGYVMAISSASSVIGSLLTFPLLKYVGRKAIFAFAGLCNAAALIGMLTWSPESHSMTVLCTFAGLWSIATAVWTWQLTSFIAVVFHDGPKEEAFTCNYLWHNGGISLWFAARTYMCLDMQIYIIAGILTVSMVCYITIEVMLTADKAKQRKSVGDQHQEHVFTINVE